MSCSPHLHIWIWLRRALDPQGSVGRGQLACWGLSRITGSEESDSCQDSIPRGQMSGGQDGACAEGRVVLRNRAEHNAKEAWGWSGGDQEGQMGIAVLPGLDAVKMHRAAAADTEGWVFLSFLPSVLTGLGLLPGKL